MSDPESGRLLQLTSPRMIKEHLQIYTGMLLDSQIMTYLDTSIFSNKAS